MEMYATEEQQVEVIKKWFNRYGSLLSWTIIGLLIILLAVKYWYHHHNVVVQRASDHYDMLLKAVDKHDDATVTHQANLLIQDYPQSVYAVFASLRLANVAVEQQDYNVAETQLQWVIEHAKQTDWRELARVRLIRLYISQNQLSKAASLYQTDKEAHAYTPILLELKGDILAKQQDTAGARQAYEAAYRAAPKEGMMGIFLKVKLEELGVDPTSLDDKEQKVG